MSDIVERLRELEDKEGWTAPVGSLCGFAADEIEKLRGEVAELKRLLGYLAPGVGWDDASSKLGDWSKL